MSSESGAAVAKGGVGVGGSGSVRSFVYNPALDGIRAFAVVAVMLFHGGALTGGYLGVDAFFVLSGFLITSLILHEVANEGRLNRARFWARRARRLLPALFLMLFAVCAYAALFAQRSELDRIRGDAIATVFYVANWHAIFSGHGYWDLFQAPSPLEHMWSLAIEEQFYVIWPLVIIAIVAIAATITRRRNHHTNPAPLVFTIALTAAICSTIWCSLLFRADDVSRAYLGTDTRVGSILFGSAFAAWTIWKGPVRHHTTRIALELLAIAATIGVAIAWTHLNGQDLLLYRGGLLLSGLGILTIIAAVAHPTHGPLHKILAWKPFVAIGLISYGLYLWHWPLYVLLNEQRTGLNGTPLLTLRIATSFAVALTSYYLIEKPIRHHPLPKKLNIIIIPLTLTALISTIYITTANATKTTSPIALSSGGGRIDLGDATAADGNANRRILVVGDSVGGNIATAAQKLQTELGLQIGDATSAGCVLPGATAARTTVNAKTQTIAFNPCSDTWVTGSQQFGSATVLFVYGTAAAFTDLQIDGKWVGACDPEYKTWYLEKVRPMLQQIALGTDVRIALLPQIEGTWVPADAKQRINCINDVSRSLAQSEANVTTINLASIVCPDGICRETIGSDPFRIDGFHYSAPAAELVARTLLADIRADSG